MIIQINPPFKGKGKNKGGKRENEQFFLNPEKFLRKTPTDPIGGSVFKNFGKTKKWYR